MRVGTRSLPQKKGKRYWAAERKQYRYTSTRRCKAGFLQRKRRGGLGKINEEKDLIAPNQFLGSYNHPIPNLRIKVLVWVFFVWRLVFWYLFWIHFAQIPWSAEWLPPCRYVRGVSGAILNFVSVNNSKYRRHGTTWTISPIYPFVWGRVCQ